MTSMQDKIEAGLRVARVAWTDVHMAYWKPISTAPMEGDVEILLYCGGSCHVGYYMDGLGWFNGDVKVEPTHWMMLPDPPK